MYNPRTYATPLLQQRILHSTPKVLSIPFDILCSVNMSDPCKNTTEMTDSVVHRSKIDIAGDLTVEDSIIYRPTINLLIDEKMMQSEFVRGFLGAVPFTQQAQQQPADGRIAWTLPVENPDVGSRTLVGIKESIGKEIRTLKAARRRFLGKIEVNGPRKQLLEDRIEKLKATNPDSGELPRLENTVRTMEQYPENADLLNEKIDDLTDLLHSITAMQEEERFSRELADACASVEEILLEAVRVANEAENIRRNG